MIRYLLYFSASVLLLTACGDGNSQLPAGGDTASHQAAETGRITVTLNGEAAELEPWPIACGVANSGVDMMAKGGLPDGDKNPGNNVLVLSIGGERRNNAITTISYKPEEGATEYVSLKGDAAPWFDGKRFEWSGRTDRGSELSVLVLCP